jgi:hypothetical protein
MWCHQFCLYSTYFLLSLLKQYSHMEYFTKVVYQHFHSPDGTKINNSRLKWISLVSLTSTDDFKICCWPYGAIVMYGELCWMLFLFRSRRKNCLVRIFFNLVSHFVSLTYLIEFNVMWKGFEGFLRGFHKQNLIVRLNSFLEIEFYSLEFFIKSVRFFIGFEDQIEF